MVDHFGLPHPKAATAATHVSSGFDEQPVSVLRQRSLEQNTNRCLFDLRVTALVSPIANLAQHVILETETRVATSSGERERVDVAEDFGHALKLCAVSSSFRLNSSRSSGSFKKHWRNSKPDSCIL